MIHLKMMFAALYLLSMVNISVQASNSRKYDGQKLLRVFPKSTCLIQEMEKQPLALCEEMDERKNQDSSINLLCPENFTEAVENVLNSNGIMHYVEISDVGQYIREMEGGNETEPDQMTWEKFVGYETIISWMEGLSNKHPSFITLIEMGRSVEGRKIYALKIGNSPFGKGTKAIWIDAGIHAREWVAITTATFIANELVKVFSKEISSSILSDLFLYGLKNPELHLKDIDWYIAPILNPDGFVFTRTEDRLWRKNRRPFPGVSNPESHDPCYGVDLNRNFPGAGFGEYDYHHCANNFMGDYAESEPETKAVVNTINKFKENIKIYISFHSYGGYWLTSWAHTTDLPQNYLELNSIGVHALNGIREQNEWARYSLGTASQVLYIAGGTSMDWARLKAGIPYAYTVEMRGKGFIEEKTNIIPIGNEMWSAMKEIAVNQDDWSNSAVSFREDFKHPLISLIKFMAIIHFIL